MHTQIYQMPANDTCTNTLLQMVIAEETRRTNDGLYIRFGGETFYTGSREKPAGKTHRRGIFRRLLHQISGGRRLANLWKKNIV